MNITPRERNHPTKAELEELLGMLLAAAEDGQLVSLTFMLKSGDDALIDYRGCLEFTEMATRVVRERIAEEVKFTDPLIAQRIQADLSRGRH